MLTGVDLHPVYQRDYVPRTRDAFVIIKATEGRTVNYDTRAALVKRCRDAGKLIGHYHWLHAGDVSAQLDHFRREADVQPGDLIAIDWENMSPSVPVSDLNAAVRGMQARFPLNRVVVYTFSCYGPFAASGGRGLELADGLWIADYRLASAQAGRPRRCDGGSLAFLMWQYTTNGETLDENKVPGFDTAAQMRAWLRGLIPPPPAPPQPDNTIPENKDTDMATTDELRAIIRAELARPEFLEAVAKHVLHGADVIPNTGFTGNPENKTVLLSTALSAILKRAD